MADDPKKLSREDILRKVLEVNPTMRVGNKSTAEVSEHLLQTVRDRRRARKFSDEKFAGVFRSMLTELEQNLDPELAKVSAQRREVSERRAKMREKYINRLVDFLVGAQPGPLNEIAREVLKEHSGLLNELGTPLSSLDRLVRDRSAEFGNE